MIQATLSGLSMTIPRRPDISSQPEDPAGGSLEQHWRRVAILRQGLSPEAPFTSATDLAYYRHVLDLIQENLEFTKPIPPGSGSPLRRGGRALRFVAMLAVRPVLRRLFQRQLLLNEGVLELAKAVIYLDSRVRVLERRLHER
jgi:hypothetical protein